MYYGQIYDTAIGKLRILQEKDAIIALNIINQEMDRDEKVSKISDLYDRSVVWQETKLLQEAIKQIREYLDGSRQTFHLPIDAEGTVFQQKVWKALRAIPYGETRTYGQIAMDIGYPKAARAVGMACNRNPILLLIPCHRVIGRDGSLTGFAAGLKVKSRLLELENNVVG